MNYQTIAHQTMPGYASKVKFELEMNKSNEKNTKYIKILNIVFVLCKLDLKKKKKKYCDNTSRREEDRMRLCIQRIVIELCVFVVFEV